MFFWLMVHNLSPNIEPEQRAEANSLFRREAEHAGVLEEVWLKLWRCIEHVEKILEDEDAEPIIVLKAAHCLSQTASTYVRLTEASEYDARLTALEKALMGRRNSHSNGAYARPERHA